MHSVHFVLCVLHILPDQLQVVPFTDGSEAREAYDALRGEPAVKHARLYHNPNANGGVFDGSPAPATGEEADLMESGVIRTLLGSGNQKMIEGMEGLRSDFETARAAAESARAEVFRLEGEIESLRDRAAAHIAGHEKAQREITAALEANAALTNENETLAQELAAKSALLDALPPVPIAPLSPPAPEAPDELHLEPSATPAEKQSAHRRK